MSELVQIGREGPVATLALNRPAVHNAFNPELVAAIHAACAELGADPSLRVLVLRGNGPSFCAGADLNWMQASLAYDHAANLADAARLDAMLAALNGLPLAVVGLAHGAALGGGAGLLACCDIVLADERAVFGFSEVRLGLLPAVIAPYVLPRIGAGHGRALFVSGRRFTAQQALAIGLAHELAPADQLGPALARITGELLRCGPQAVAAAKALVRAVGELPAEAARRYAIEAIAGARTGPEGQEGLRAFIEKRPPGWVV